MATITLQCSECKKEFKKEKGEYNRRLRLGKDKFFCSLNCSGVEAVRVNPLPIDTSGRILNYCDNKRDELTPFRFYTRSIRKLLTSKRGHKNKREKFLLSDIDELYLKELWENQKGIDPITGWQLFLPFDADGWKSSKDPRRASLDRIDNSKGYIKGNIRFVSYMTNMARNVFTDEEVLCFSKAVVEHHDKEKNL